MSDISIRSLFPPTHKHYSSASVGIAEEMIPLLPSDISWLRIVGLSRTQISSLLTIYRYECGGLAELYTMRHCDPPRHIALLEDTRPCLDQLCKLISDPHSPLNMLLEPINRWRKQLSRKLPDWQLRHGPLTFEQPIPLIMGIINITPDSFSDGGLYFDRDKAIDHALQLVEDGADLLDIGGESTRPGSLSISASEESKRVIPMIKALASQVKIPISVDTTKSEVAQAALDVGAEIVNDISCLRFDPLLAHIVAKHRAKLILMHSRHTPANMQQAPFYHCLWDEIFDELDVGLQTAIDAGITRDYIVLDPGLGFAKRPQDNFRILREFSVMRAFGLPILIGASRKSFIGKILQTPTSQRLEGSLAAAAAATFYDAQIIRVHDVAPTRMMLQILSAIKSPQLS